MVEDVTEFMENFVIVVAELLPPLLHGHYLFGLLIYKDVQLLLVLLLLLDEFLVPLTNDLDFLLKPQLTLNLELKFFLVAKYFI